MTQPHPFVELPVLENAHVRLEPLSHGHADDLAHAVEAGRLWEKWTTTIPSPETMAQTIEQRLDLHRAGKMVPWAIIDPATDRAVGMTTYMNLVPEHRRLEIGSTWLGKEAQGRTINPAAKLLLLTRAFEELNTIAVEFRTHFHNFQSRAAIAKLGAKQDGVLRSHQLDARGNLRDTVVFSIIAAEWPTVKYGLQQRLAR